ncbi:MAG: hypothetical protein CMI54_07575 [Parcubacteria group bacterium]|nr:hypothetical protein [Parcubacteria group bacterium]|tara:strand:- start:331 stop:1512 length:1182 start_codon:yes stop_codon:yes gene_type:complete
MGLDGRMKLILENWRKFLAEAEGDLSAAIGARRGDIDLSAEFGKERAARIRAAIAPSQSEEEKEEKLSHPEEFLTPSEYSETNKHNVAQLLIYRDGTNGPNIFNRLDIRARDVDIHKMISKIPPLTKNKIVDMIGVGTQKYAYMLDNDHILSLFMGGYQEYKDLDWYADIQNRQFRGQSSIDEPSIVDYGGVKVEDAAFTWTKSQKGQHLIRYVEMSGVIPLSVKSPVKLGAVTGEREIDKLQIAMRAEVDAISSFVRDAYHYDSPNTGFANIRPIMDKNTGEYLKLKQLKPEEQIEQLQHWWQNKSRIPWLDDPGFISTSYGTSKGIKRYISWAKAKYDTEAFDSDLKANLLKTLANLVIRAGHDYRVLGDLHLGNIGMSKENPDEFIVFDI